MKAIFFGWPCIVVMENRIAWDLFRGAGAEYFFYKVGIKQKAV
jgi:hypothetical protein